ncbi:L-lysine 2-3-aminomutase [Penicillium fimorum]|uniref:L-lysine 2-3-aminomutase n=1 Tax=Penicillium fimorum TaxID=1882269 RepID=A0A9W9Y5U1_9EURO|nr:L-lysine 2-3-aminomutase [Penicillium fimorum]
MVGRDELLLVGLEIVTYFLYFVNLLYNIVIINAHSYTYDHRVWKTGLPVRSAVLKPHAGELVVGWVTTSESSLLYVFIFASGYLLPPYSFLVSGHQIHYSIEAVESERPVASTRANDWLFR